MSQDVYLPTASYSITIRVKIDSRPGHLGMIATRIGEAGGDIGAIDIVEVSQNYLIRDFTVNCVDEHHGERIVKALDNLPGVEVINVSDVTFLAHLGGKIEMKNRIPVKTRSDLSRAYTPGVARVCMAIAQDPGKAYSLTIKKNTVAVVSDGTAVLGLGDIGPEAAMPVMEGKAMLFKEFAGVDGWPICLDTKDVDAIVEAVKAIAPGFGGINLEDISAPRCFEIEERLKKELDIPVMHDDQHGTAVVVLAALLNALKLVKKPISEIKVVVNGIGAAGTACSKMLMAAGVKNIIGCDKFGIVHRDRMSELPVHQQWYAEHTNPEGVTGGQKEALVGADFLLGVSGPGTIHPEYLATMAPDAIVFALANPTPEIMPEEAMPHAKVIATGRSDYPNQINNVLVFPGIFRGALDCRASEINEAMKLAAANAIAEIIPEEELRADYIIPSVFNRKVAPAVAKAVIQAAYETGVARRERRSLELETI
ncbi:MAG: malic enzyme-like NAD(P)-binding protein [Candidatus Sericytochromatia bacterium]